MINFTFPPTTGVFYASNTDADDSPSNSNKWAGVGRRNLSNEYDDLVSTADAAAVPKNIFFTFFSFLFTTEKNRFRTEI